MGREGKEKRRRWLRKMKKKEGKRWGLETQQGINDEGNVRRTGRDEGGEIRC